MEQKVANSTKSKESKYTKEMELNDAYTGKLLGIFSERLKELMKHSTQEDVEKATGISRQNLSKYMSGKALPNTKNLFILTKYFDVSCDYLLGFINLPHNELSHFRLKINFSDPCTKKLEYISKDVILSELFDRLITKNSFIQLLKYIETYLTFSAKLKKGSTERIKESRKRAGTIDVSNNKHISFESYPDHGIEVSKVYKGLIQETIHEIISMIAKEASAEYTEKITRIAQEELIENDQKELTSIEHEELNDSI